MNELTRRQFHRAALATLGTTLAPGSAALAQVANKLPTVRWENTRYPGF